jgi:hypothetical protein
MSNSSDSSHSYRETIAGDIAPVRPLPKPSRRVWLLVPIGLMLAATAPFVNGIRGDLLSLPYAPLITWGATGLQAMLGLWLLALGFREAVPGRNVSGRSLALAAGLTIVLVSAITLLTNAASATVVPPGDEWRDWWECVVFPAMIGSPFMVIATLMAARAFPTRPSIAGALCGLSAGVLSDAGWRLSCWISDPVHLADSHVLAILSLAAAGSLLATVLDSRHWRRLGKP